MSESNSVQGILSSMLHNPPKERRAVCETHGEFVAVCHFRDAWSKCPSCDAEKAAAKKAQQEAEEQHRVAAIWEAKLSDSCIPLRFRDRSLQNYRATTPEQRTSLAFANEFAAMFSRNETMAGRCAIFGGQPGTGKTHLACGIAQRIMQDYRCTVLFLTVIRAIRAVKETWGKGAKRVESEVIADLVFPDLLILDEVGVQFGSETEKMILFDVLNTRYEQRKSTLLLTNLTADECRDYLGDRVFDRLREDGGRYISFIGESMRGKLAA